MPSANIRTRWTNSDMEFYAVQTGTTIMAIDDAGAVDLRGTLKLGGVAVTNLTAAELGVLVGVTPGTRTASRAIVVDANGKINALDITALSLGGTAVTANATEVSEYSVQVYMPDANTPGSVYAYIPHAGSIRGLSVVAQAANGGAETVFGAAIGGVAVTHGAWKLAVGAVAGGKESVVPTADNEVAADSVLEITSDGGGNTVMPVMLSVKILR